MTIIDNTYFSNELSLPVDNINVQSYIDKHEPIILEKVLGYSLYQDFDTGINEAVPLSKWTDLKNGAEFTTSNSVLANFKGLKDIVSRYVFVAIVADKQNFTTDMGVKIGNAENSEHFNPRYKQIEAQYDMVNMISVLNDFINVKNTEVADTYKNYLPQKISKGNIFNI